MFDLPLLMDIAYLNVEALAAAEGRAVRPDEYTAALSRAWDIWLNSRVEEDMARAGFVKTASGWARPRPWWRFW